MDLDFKKTFKTGMRKMGNGVRTVAQGGAVDGKFFKKHFVLTSLVVMFCMFFIASRFTIATKEGTIRNLRREIEIERTFMNQEVSRYHTLTRESAMQHLVDSLKLGLCVPEADPERRPGELTLEP